MLGSAAGFELTSWNSDVGDLGSIPGRDRAKSLKQVLTAPLPNAWQQVSRVHGDYHFKGLARVKVG